MEGSSSSGFTEDKKLADVERRKLKKTCESCARSKLKCSGEYPICNRCKKHGKECVYKPRKKRVNKPKKPKSETSADCIVAKRPDPRKCTCLDGFGCILGKEECDNDCVEYMIENHRNMLLPMLPPVPVSPLNRVENVEKYSWNIYSALAGTYANSHKYGLVTVLLRRQFRAFQIALRRSKTATSKEYQSKLNEILVSQEIDMEKTYAMSRKLLPIRFPNRKQIGYDQFKRFSMFRNNETERETGQLEAAGGHVEEGCVSGSCEMLQSGKLIIQEMKESINSRVPMLRMRTDMFYDERDRNSYFKVQLNPSFEQVFGYGDKELKALLESSAAGFLPFGSSVLSFLVARASDLMSYVQVMCVKNSLEEPETLPWYTEIPTVQCLDLKARKGPFELGTTPMPFMLQTVYRRYMDESSSYEEVYLLLKPLQSIDHLFEFDAVDAFPNINQLGSECHSCHNTTDTGTQEGRTTENDVESASDSKQETKVEWEQKFDTKLPHHYDSFANPEDSVAQKRTRSESLNINESATESALPDSDEINGENGVDSALLELVLDGMSFDPFDPINASQ
eukprot:CAMPEP_0184017718 /NCGR_PEP_ID=MMETSP0954-20121128/7712_1 /TAXON_ID=627963 /ORGANISM="Aplanochytrium sp, Strain PBS07" /LENGTH=565 /DNA_ID=CAMNT_0026299025 /DNA_START=367 /DNA_END=2064 /DNA_ORIENTATION=-